jgi:hypothetical protein
MGLSHFRSFLQSACLSAQTRPASANFQELSKSMSNSKRKRIRSECQKEKDLDLKPSLKRTKMEQLPTEILVDIFTFLNIQDLGRCGQVCKRWSIISQDEKAWMKINLCLNSISTDFIEHICYRGAKYLGLRSATIAQWCVF